jgi:hypothetical protein
MAAYTVSMSKSQSPKHIQFIRELCKGKSENEILEAEANFRQYLLVIKKICKRLRRERRAGKAFDERHNLQ